MALLHIRKIFTRAKSPSSSGFSHKNSPKDSEPFPPKTLDSHYSDSIYSIESADIEEAKRQAYEERRARQAEEYLANHGFTSYGLGGGISLPRCRS